MPEGGVEIQLTIQGLDRAVQAISRARSNASDLRPFFGRAAEIVRQAVLYQFSTVGGRSGGWAPLSPWYAAWKASRGYGMRPIMVLTGRLSKSLIDREGNVIEEIHPDHMRWGTSVPYAAKHQLGLGRLPQRKLIDLNQDDMSAMLAAMREHLVQGV